VHYRVNKYKKGEACARVLAQVISVHVNVKHCPSGRRGEGM
jgi:hypothetical protein